MTSANRSGAKRATDSRFRGVGLQLEVERLRRRLVEIEIEIKEREENISRMKAQVTDAI